MKTIFMFILFLSTTFAQEKPMMQSMSPELMVDDVNKTVGFYREVLGFELVSSVPDSGQFDWAMMKNGPVEIMFESTGSLAKNLPAFAGQKPGGTVLLYVRVADVKALYAKVKGKASIVHDLAKAFYGMEEFAIKDPNGYCLMFATPVQ